MAHSWQRAEEDASPLAPEAEAVECHPRRPASQPRVQRQLQGQQPRDAVAESCRLEGEAAVQGLHVPAQQTSRADWIQS